MLSDGDRKFLKGVLTKTTSPQSHVARAKIALGVAGGLTHDEIISFAGVSGPGVSNWRKRFSLFGVSVLSDAPRSGSPRIHNDDKIAEIIGLTTTAEPKGATHWSTTQMAKVAGVSQPTVFRVWRAFGLKPHLIQYYTISNDPNFADKTRDVVGAYLNPPEAAVVLSIDEKTQIQALNRTQPIVGLVPGVPERRTTEYLSNRSSPQMRSSRRWRSTSKPLTEGISD